MNNPIQKKIKNCFELPGVALVIYTFIPKLTDPTFLMLRYIFVGFTSLQLEDKTLSIPTLCILCARSKLQNIFVWYDDHCVRLDNCRVIKGCSDLADTYDRLPVSTRQSQLSVGVTSA